MKPGLKAVLSWWLRGLSLCLVYHSFSPDYQLKSIVLFRDEEAPSVETSQMFGNNTTFTSPPIVVHWSKEVNVAVETHRKKTI